MIQNYLSFFAMQLDDRRCWLSRCDRTSSFPQYPSILLDIIHFDLNVCRTFDTVNQFESIFSSLKLIFSNLNIQEAEFSYTEYLNRRVSIVHRLLNSKRSTVGFVL